MHYIPLLYLALFAMIAFSMPAEAGVHYYQALYDVDNPCRDWIDNDADGLTDWNDPSCNKIGTPNSWFFHSITGEKIFKYKERTACSDGRNTDYGYNLNNPPYPGAPAWDGVDFDGGYVGSGCYKLFKDTAGVEWPTVQHAIDAGMRECVVDTDFDGSVSRAESDAAPWALCWCYAPSDPQCVVPGRDTEGKPGQGNCGLLGIEPFLLLGWPMWRRWRG